MFDLLFFLTIAIQYSKDMFLIGGGKNAGMQVKKKRHHKGQGGGGHHHGGNGWGQQGGWGGHHGGNGWGGNQGGWEGQEDNGWGGQGGNNGWGNQGSNDGWGGNQGGNGWGNQGGQGGQGPWNMGFTHNQSQWGNNLHGQEWVEEQKKRNEFNFFQPGQENTLDINDLINQQIVFIEPSPSKQRLEELKALGEPFVDDRFPPEENSLSGDYGPQNNWSQITWEKISEQMTDPKIFQGKIEPGDIKQGYLGDCYFLAGLAALAERPDRIYNLFLLQQLNEIHYYSVKILFKGKWVTIDMDEYIPYLYGKPAFTKANESELWVVLLEKAWAKLYSSYKRIQAGYPEEALHDLTGAPIKQLYLQHSSFDKERDWQYLVKASQLEYSMVASSMPGSDTNKSYSGVVQGHAYTVLNATYLKVGGSQARIMQLRNPWGKGEFKGQWSDEDPSWEDVDQAEKERVGYHPDVSDGIFFMSYDDFIAEFRALTVAEINDDASYVYKSYKDPQRKGAYFTVQILEAGQYSFNIGKTPQRIYPEKIQEAFRYPEAHLEIGKLNGGSCERYQGIRSARRTLFRYYNLQPGTYVVWAKIAYQEQFQNQFDVNLAVYAPFACNVRLATKDQAVSFSGDPDVDWEGQEQAEEKPWNSQGNNKFDSQNHFGFKGGWDSNDGWGGQGGNDGWGGQGGNDGW